jgi:thioredoxin-like negative regulator of GroEL
MSRRLSIVLPWALALVGAGPLMAAPWQTAETAEFIVLGDAKAARIGEVLESIEVYRNITSRFRLLRDPAPYKPRVFVLSPASFKHYTRSREGVAGFIKLNDYEMDIVVESRESNDWFSNRHIIQHELTHFYLRLNARSALPVWYNEGLSEFFSTVSFKGKKARIGDVPMVRFFTLRNRSWMPMQQVFAVDRSSPEYGSHKLNDSLYAQSWLLVHYMMLKEPSLAPKFEEMILQQGAGLDALQAMRTSLGERASTLDDELRRYAASSAWTYRYFERPAESLKVAGLRPLQPEATGTEIGGLLLRLNRFSAEELQTEINRLLPAPSSADGAAIKAMVNLRAGQAAAVDPLLEQCEANANGARSLRLCALSWMTRASKATSEDERIRTQRRAAAIAKLALRSDALEFTAIGMLLHVRNALGENTDDLYPVVEQALEKMPSSFALRLTLAESYFRAGQLTAAQRHLEHAALYDTEPLRRDHALRLLREVENSMVDKAKR